MRSSTQTTMVAHVTLQYIFFLLSDQQAGLQICTELYVKLILYGEMGLKGSYYYLQWMVWEYTFSKGKTCVGELSATVICFRNTYSFLCTFGPCVTCEIINHIYKLMLFLKVESFLSFDSWYWFYLHRKVIMVKRI